MAAAWRAPARVTTAAACCETGGGGAGQGQHLEKALACVVRRVELVDVQAWGHSSA